MSIEQDAVCDIYEILNYEAMVLGNRDGLMQSKLGGVINWASCYKSQLGTLLDFLHAKEQHFHVNSSNGAGKNKVSLKQDTLDHAALDASEGESSLYGPFTKEDFVDTLNQFQEAIANKVIAQKFAARRSESVASALDGETSARKIFNLAYAKCARLTVAIGHVVNSADVTSSEIEGLLRRFLPEDERVRLFVMTKETTNFFSEVSVTFTGPDAACLELQHDLACQLSDGRIHYKTKTLSLYQTVYPPVFEAVTDTVRDLLAQQKKNLHETQPATLSLSPTTPTLAATLLRAVRPVPITQDSLPPAGSVWPIEYAYDSPAERICDGDKPSPLSELMATLSAEMQEKEAQLRALCAETRDLSQQQKIRARFGNEKNCEWIAQPQFMLGQGFEATIYMGLYKDPANPDKESVLVAIKQSRDGTNPFNSQERDHLMNLKRRAGIAQYHTSFEVETSFMTLFIVALDIGLLSLRETTKKVEMTREQKFKMTKALCMAVKDLHNECSVVHRDLRPENVLLMRDGTVCITDFGLSRTAAVGGASVYTKQPKTAMQPFEVQKHYGAGEVSDAEIPITHGGDVFMLGCVLAFLHQGRDPFTDNRQILEKCEPDLDKVLEIQQPWLVHLIRSMLQHDIYERPTIAYVLKHPYFVGHTANFDACLIRGIEYSMVMDSKPKDNNDFHALEAVLHPVEQRMAAAQVPWHAQLPAAIFIDYKLPFIAYPLTFAVDGVDLPPPRSHPMPLLAQVLRWHRNVINHFSESMQIALRRTKGILSGDSSHYSTGGEFFTTHPAVAWLLPAIWTQVHKSVANIERERIELIKENERRIKQHNVMVQTLTNLSLNTARVLEWNK